MRGRRKRHKRLVPNAPNTWGTLGAASSVRRIYPECMHPFKGDRCKLCNPDREPWSQWASNGPSLPCPRCNEPMERRNRDRPPEWFKGYWHTAWDHCAICRDTVFYEAFEQHVT